MAKPAVDGIEAELEKARLVRLNAMSRAGGTLASGWGVRGLPTLVVFDGDGEIVLRQVGRIHREAVLESVRSLAR